MGEWREVSLSEVAAEVTVGHVGPMANQYREQGIPFLRSQNVQPHHVDLTDVKYIDQDFHDRLKKSSLAPGDVVTVRTGKPGTSAVMPNSVRVANCSDLVITRPGPHLDARWLSYYLNFVVDSHIGGFLVGAVQQHFNVQSAKNLKLLLPEIAEQRAIAEVLGALDDKIVANEQVRRIADDLLASVFDRLRAGSLHVELRAIGTVNRAVTKPVPGGRLRYVDISSVSQGFFDFPRPMSWDHAPSRARRVLSRGDTVWSTVRPNRRSHALVFDDDPLLVASTGLAVLSPKPGRVAGLLEATKTDEFVRYLESVTEGSAYPAVSAESFERAPVPHLSEDQWNSFEQLALPVRLRVHAAERESRRLARTRDALLPLLMSGKLRVKEAQAAVSEVV